MSELPEYIDGVPSISGAEAQVAEAARHLKLTAQDLKKFDLKGETLTIFGPWRGDDEAHIQVVLEYFRQATGATPPSVSVNRCAIVSSLNAR